MVKGKAKVIVDSKEKINYLERVGKTIKNSKYEPTKSHGGTLDAKAARRQ